MRQVFLDTETTGLSPSRAIASSRSAASRSSTGADRAQRPFLRQSRAANSIDAYKVHGLSDEFLADKPLFGHIVDELIEFVRDAEIIIHNAAFDVGFLDAELRRMGRPAFLEHGVRVTDSLSMARDSFPGKSNSLDALCKRFEVNNTARAAARRRCSTRGCSPRSTSA